MFTDSTRTDSTHRLARLLAAFVMPFALIAAFLAATPAPVAAGQASSANLAFQIFTCPLGYAGDEYLFDCTPGPAGDEITVSGAADGSSVEGITADDGTYALDYPAGETTVTFGLTDPNSFYYACFDTTSGSEVYLFDGTTNIATLNSSAGESFSCRFYVTPSEVVPPGDNAADAATFEFQVFECPVAYEGDAYLTDCAPVEPTNPIEVQLVSGPEFDIESDTLLTGNTGDEGRIPFRLLPPGTWSAALNISERVNSFYYACFDATSGEEDFLFDGGGVQLTGEIAVGGILSCRWYIIPQELPSAAPSDDSFGASAEFQVYECPVAYEGDEYLFDCEPADAEFPVEVQLSGGPELDPDTALSGMTDDDGFVRFTGLVGGTYTAYLNVPGEFATFYLACFDATGGGESFLYDGEANLTTFEVAEDATISCRWYIIPEDLRGPEGPSASATIAPSASASGVPVAVLPSTGTGTGSSGTTSPTGALAVAALMATIAVAFVTRRLGSMIGA